MGIQAATGVAKRLSRIEGELLHLKTRVNRDTARIAELEAKLAAYRVVLPDIAEAMVPPEFAPVRPSVKRGLFRHGQLVRLCLEALRTAQGQLSTVEMLNYAADQAGVTFSSQKEREHYRRMVKERMCSYEKKGLVVRAAKRVPGAQRGGVWRLARK